MARRRQIEPNQGYLKWIEEQRERGKELQEEKRGEKPPPPNGVDPIDGLAARLDEMIGVEEEIDIGINDPNAYKPLADAAREQAIAEYKDAVKAGGYIVDHNLIVGEVGADKYKVGKDRLGRVKVMPPKKPKKKAEPWIAAVEALENDQNVPRFQVQAEGFRPERNEGRMYGGMHKPMQENPYGEKKMPIKKKRKKNPQYVQSPFKIHKDDMEIKDWLTVHNITMGNLTNIADGDDNKVFCSDGGFGLTYASYRLWVKYNGSWSNFEGLISDWDEDIEELSIDELIEHLIVMQDARPMRRRIPRIKTDTNKDIALNSLAKCKANGKKTTKGLF